MMYYVRLVLQYAVTLFVALSINFFLPRLAPGEPINSLLPQDVIDEMSEEQIQRVLADYGLDLPILEQFWNYFTGIFSGDFGISVALGKPVWDVLIDRLPWTLLLMGCTLIISTLIGTFLGVISAWKRGNFTDVSITGIVLFIGSLPSFWIAMMFIVLFSTTLGWLPTFGAYPIGVPVGSWDWYLGVGKRMIMPLSAMVLVRGASVLLISRSAMLMSLDTDYIMFARAKGVSENRVFFSHAFRNAMLPLYTNVMMSIGGLIGGALVIETVFSYPGLGSVIGIGVGARDYNLLQGMFVFATLSVIVANFLTDLFYPLIDPRTRKTE